MFYKQEIKNQHFLIVKILLELFIHIVFELYQIILYYSMFITGIKEGTQYSYNSGNRSIFLRSLEHRKLQQILSRINRISTVR